MVATAMDFCEWSFQDAGAMSLLFSRHVGCIVFQATVVFVQSYLPYFICRNTRLEEICSGSCSYTMICIRPIQTSFLSHPFHHFTYCVVTERLSRKPLPCFWWNSSREFGTNDHSLGVIWKNKTVELELRLGSTFVDLNSPYLSVHGHPGYSLSVL